MDQAVLSPDRADLVDTLIKNKRALARDKDLVDASELEAVLKTGRKS